MNPDQHGPHAYHRPGPPMPPYAVPPRKRRGRGCLYGAIGGAATLFLMASCGAIVATTGGAADPAATSGDSPAASAPAGGDAGEKKDEKQPKKITNGIGREYRDGKFAFTVTKVRKGVKKVGNEYVGDTAQGQFVFIHVTVKNIGDEARSFTHHNQTLIDTEDREFEADPEASMWSGQDTKSFLQQINPGNSVKGTLIYDVPRGTKLKAIELHDSMFSRGVTVPLGGG
ncbi:DUF4352 domain-containing protein [Actinomadura livida]|uniref:DUF4352 domain-containing protein n=1 Tax=Actinomadura livida TaxID=79909 RepID=A0A7W7IC99_9ACTN|nr:MULTISPECIES: DUF4352 domain-containing protein [Actinomadura]MBB4774444.1 hypothetical protein [Actinomadura catellatispora]GGT82496.1 hypothetical protein GCM10010208_01010 [Actinomadura livida]